MEGEVAIFVLRDGGDARGRSFGVTEGWLTRGFRVQDAHITTVNPGSTRGNHYHLRRQELFVVMHADRWSLHWDTGPDTSVASRAFTGAGSALVQIPPGASHAIHNDGDEVLHLVGLSDGPFDPAAPDAYARVVFGPR